MKKKKYWKIDFILPLKLPTILKHYIIHWWNYRKIVTLQLCKMHWFFPSKKKSFGQRHKNTEGIHDNQRHVCPYNSTNAYMMWLDTQLFGLNPGIGFRDYTRTHILPILQTTFHTSLSYFGLDWVHLATRIETHRNLIKANRGIYSSSNAIRTTGHQEKFNPQIVHHQESRHQLYNSIAYPAATGLYKCPISAWLSSAAEILASLCIHLFTSNPFKDPAK